MAGIGGLVGSWTANVKLKLAVDNATSTSDEPTPSEWQPIVTGRSGVKSSRRHSWPSRRPARLPLRHTPCAVYVLDELTHAMAAGDARAGVDAVCSRLAHRSPVVKQKVCSPAWVARP